MSTSKELPELTDERIEVMRRTIMRGVQVESERRRKRGRMLLGAAAAVVAVGIGSSVIASLPSSNDSGSDSASAGSAASDSGGSSAERFGPAPAAGDLASGDGPADENCTACHNSQSDAKAGREVITSGSITLTVAKPQEAAQKISDLVESLGGRTDQRSESAAKGNDDAQAHLTIRVPSAKVKQTIDKLVAFGTVENVSIDNTVVTT
ncbi:MAG: hypothetical protein JWP10_124, partial [Nocardioidaceae bacterium]|nr:hypothetical protein [Nocardioidaceae bacterium]